MALARQGGPAPIERTIEVGNRLIDFRVAQTVEAIRVALGSED